MKKIRFILTLAAIMVAASGFVSCSDDEEFDPKEELADGMTAYRGFVLSEGSYGQNNSHLVYVNPNTLTAWTTDAYETANSQKIGDTAQGLIEYDGSLYYVVNGSNYVVRLDASGKEQARYSMTSEQGQPRYLVAYKGKVYVTAYGGYIVRLDAETLKYEAQVATDANPEQIVEMDGTLYTVCSGYGAGHTMSVVSASDFSKAESKEIMGNPYALCEAGGELFIAAYDSSYASYVYEYNTATGKYTQLGGGSRMVEADGKLYYANSTSSDYITYTTSFSVYDPATATTSTWNLSTSAAPSAFNTGVVYMLVFNDFDDRFYIGTTDYFSNGTVCVFDVQGSYLGSFSSGGINPNSMAFVKVE